MNMSRNQVLGMLVARNTRWPFVWDLSQMRRLEYANSSWVWFKVNNKVELVDISSAEANISEEDLVAHKDKLNDKQEKRPMKRIYDLKIYFADSPTPLFVENVWHMNTEGGLLRLIIEGKSQWYPLVNIANIREVNMREE